MTKKKLSTAKDAAGIPSTRASLSQPPKLLIQPLFKSLVESEYNFIRCLHVWGLEITDDIAVTLVSCDSYVQCKMDAKSGGIKG